MINFKNYKNIIIKIGSSLIVDKEKGKINISWLKKLAKEIAYLKSQNISVILVSSGSIACACNILKTEKHNLNLGELQAHASFGQAELMHIYKKIFIKNNIKISQLLITGDDCQNRKRYLNMRASLCNLLKMDILPIINENDAVTTEEIQFGDNDNLSSQVAGLIDADLLILLSDVAGLYDSNPKTNEGAKLIKNIDKIDKKISNLAGTEKSFFGTGGMYSKIQAAKNSTSFGIDTIIASGFQKKPIRYLESKDFYSFFKGQKKISSRKKWLKSLKENDKKIIINKNAEKALLNKKSLLPIGIISIEGNFDKGDIIGIYNENNNKIAKGLSNFSNSDLAIIQGKNSNKIKAEFNISKTEAIHIDNMIII